MDLGIEEFRNYELFKRVTVSHTARNDQILTFYEAVKL